MSNFISAILGPGFSEMPPLSNVTALPEAQQRTFRVSTICVPALLALSTEDIVEGVIAFFEKRDPVWRGR